MDGDEAARVPLVVERVLALEPVHVLVVLLGYGRGAPLLARAVEQRDRRREAQAARRA